MGRQFGFSMDENDEKAFFEFLRQDNVIYFNESRMKPKAISEFPVTIWIIMYIYNERFGKLVFHEYDQGKFSIRPMDAPVIEFCQTFVRDNEQRIQRGRLWFDIKYWDNGVWKQKDKSIEGVYKQCVKWIKKNLKCIIIQRNGYQKKEYISKSLEQKALAGYHFC